MKNLTNSANFGMQRKEGKMADVRAGNGGKQRQGLKNKHDDFMDRFNKFKKTKQIQPLQERGKSTNNNCGQKRKSCPDSSSTKVPFKKSKENRGTPGHVSRHKPTPSKADMTRKPVVSQGSIQKPESNGNKGDTETEHEDTPMLVRLQRWKDEKQKSIQEKKKDNRKSCPGLSGSCKKYVQPGGPRPLQQSRPRQSDTAQNLTRKPVSLTTHKAPSTEKPVNKWERLSRGSSTKPKDGVLSRAMSNSRTSISSKGSMTERTRQGVTRAGSQDKVNKRDTNVRGRTTQKPEVKRRHSEVQARGSPLRRPGILKRKSCIASFGDNGETDANNRVLCDDETAVLSPTSGKTGQTTVKDLPCRTPDTARTVRFYSPQSQTTDSIFRKTPSKYNTKEESMRNRLNNWLVAKGKTPSKFRHLMCFDAKMSARKKSDPKTKRNITVEELTVQQETMEKETTLAVNLAGMFDKVADEEKEETEADDHQTQEDPGLSQLRTILDECTILFEAGCPHTDILKWLDSIEQNIPLARKSAIFYICKAQVLQSTADLDSVLKVFEEAVINAAQPAQELATALTAIVKDISKERERKAHQKGIEKRIQEENIFESTAIKYCVRQVTPFSKRSRKSTGDTSTGSQCTVLTPVRRSTRRSLASLPDSLQEKTPVFNTLEELSDSDKKKTLYKENNALKTLYSEDEVLEKVSLDFNDLDNDVLT
ncbi:cytoskeleton-associated protein 2-like isoform X2 [Pecten maximus]|uniref:cytoskeleton-associated protein 2-like isoform X1 n=1 Tax=Pecten maximus TaxID=6579 RepID=UPI001457F20F|nr:cytoskeleton-associated protein 2-like isoform X1 [Pecten maximus]XP_033743477.1 cytoskeleton-associated protein 2-like isoform X2 [Pecten maximus]